MLPGTWRPEGCSLGIHCTGALFTSQSATLEMTLVFFGFCYYRKLPQISALQLHEVVILQGCKSEVRQSLLGLTPRYQQGCAPSWKLPQRIRSLPSPASLGGRRCSLARGPIPPSSEPALGGPVLLTLHPATISSASFPTFKALLITLGPPR